MMKLTIAVLASLLVATGAAAQSRGAFYGPFTGYEADALSDVWPEIREAEAWEDINWRALGVRRVPGSSDAQRLIAENWRELRREERFADIDWNDYVDGPRASRNDRTDRFEDRTDRFERQFPGGAYSSYDDGPFTRDEATIMSRVWPEIRDAAAFEDVNWRAFSLSGAPGDLDARRLMSRHWRTLREADRFEDIDWEATTGYRVSSGNRPRG
jgi:hypothetical protein